MTSELTATGRSRHAIAVVTNKSWYEGFVPLFVYFAQRSCPAADILVFTMGKIDPLVPATLDALGCNPSRYRLIANFGTEFGQSPLASKMARWVVPLEPDTDGYETLYVGDIDILLTREPDEDIFAQHLTHSGQLGIPISNMIRPNSKRLTGLHFVRLPEYLAQTEAPLRALKELLIGTQNDPEALLSHYPNPGGDEKALYSTVNEANATWIDALQGSQFRPHHGVHLGLFRNEGQLGSVLINALRDNDLDMPRYWQDVAPELTKTIQSQLWTDLFAAYPRVEISCRQFLKFYQDWCAGLYDKTINTPEGA